MVSLSVDGGGFVPVFQYSLCRVVLMVVISTSPLSGARMFQYSLCRVVLMVGRLRSRRGGHDSVSVLALSSRFDGPHPLNLHFIP